MEVPVQAGLLDPKVVPGRKGPDRLPVVDGAKSHEGQRQGQL